MRFDSLAGVGLACWVLVVPMAAAMVLPRESTGLLSKLTQTANDKSTGQKTSDTSSSLVSLLANKTSLPHSASDVGSVQEAQGKINRAHSNLEANKSSDLLDLTHDLVGSGLIPLDLVSLLDGYLDMSLNSIHNKNPPPPSKQAIYPSKKTGDAPYSIPEEKLRAVIHIPDSFIPDTVPVLHEGVPLLISPSILDQALI